MSVEARVSSHLIVENGCTSANRPSIDQSNFNVAHFSTLRLSGPPNDQHTWQSVSDPFTEHGQCDLFASDVVDSCKPLASTVMRRLARTGKIGNATVE